MKMKKMMTVAAAALCAAVGFADGLTSDNVVGYASGQLDDDYGSKILGTQFVSCGNTSGKFALSELKPIPSGSLTAADLINNVSFQILNNWGGTVDGSDRIWDGTKWVNESLEDMSDELYTSGQGLCVYNYADPDVGGVDLQSFGAVNKADVILNLDDDYGSVMIANPYPVPVKLSALLPAADAVVDLANNVSFQKINNWGGTVEGSDRIWDGSKWVTEDLTDCSNEELAPGEGICVYNYVDPDDAKVSVRIAAPTSSL